MNEFEIKFAAENPQSSNSKIIISIGEEIEKGMLYKYFAGLDGKWSLLKDFSKDKEVEWKPKEDGEYTIMVQARKEEENKPFNYLSKTEYTIGDKKKELISKVTIDKEELILGDKLTAKVDAYKAGLLFKYQIKQEDTYILLKDYSPDDMITWTATKIGSQELIVHCKSVQSMEEYDDCAEQKFNVMPIEKIEITDFKCLTEELLMDSEITFEVDIKYDDSRLVLYKFVRIDEEGQAKCIQNYSTKRMVSYVEGGFGKFRVLCMVKDMYSPAEYDERAVIIYNVKKYRPINIRSFSTDMSSPQATESKINLKAVVTGGRNLAYRYIIEGVEELDSGYINEDNFTWKPSKAGSYNLKLLVKDLSFEGEAEDSEDIKFVIEEINYDPVVIKEIIKDRDTKLLVGNTINIKAVAQGGTDLRYAFNVKNEKGHVENISYGTCNWVNYTAEKPGNYELEVRVKDKFSNKEYDSHSFVYITVYKYIPAAIDYVLMPRNDYRMVGDKIELTVVCENTNEVLNRYVLKINDRAVEETEYMSASKYSFDPKIPGLYEIDIMAKNKKSERQFDSKKHLKLMVYDTLPITNTVIECDRVKMLVNETVNFSVSSHGGREVVYEFYLYEKGEWSLIQKYSRKSYYTFMPFHTGYYKILVLSKSQFKKNSYEDYSILEFKVEK